MEISSVNGLTKQSVPKNVASDKKVSKPDSKVNSSPIVYDKSRLDSTPYDFKSKHVELSKLQDSLLKAQVDGDAEGVGMIKEKIRSLMNSNGPTSDQVHNAMLGIRAAYTTEFTDNDRTNTLELLQ